MKHDLHQSTQKQAPKDLADGIGKRDDMLARKVDTLVAPAEVAVQDGKEV
jgi:hypothetical protein